MLEALEPCWLSVPPPVACWPSEPTDTLVVRWSARVWTKMSSSPLVSPLTRLSAPEVNDTVLPSAEMLGPTDSAKSGWAG